MRVVDETLRELKRGVDGVPMPAEIRALRKKLKLSQAAVQPANCSRLAPTPSTSTNEDW